MTSRGAALGAVIALLALSASRAAAAASGTQGASFLDIPVGGRPAALGGAYSAFEGDAYSPIYNPGGLGFLPSTQLSGMHLEYAGVGGYEFVSFVRPRGERSGLGVAAQFFHAGGTTARDVNGSAIGSESTHYGAYSLAYGRAITNKLSVGAAVKLIDARIAEVSARAVAGEVGGLYRVNDRVNLAAVANLGGRLKFFQQSDSLPENYRVSFLCKPLPPLGLAGEAAYDGAGQFFGRLGAEWRPGTLFAVRAGYRTETTRQLSAMAGLSTGFGVELFGQRFDYAWVPLGDLGESQYFSVVITFGKKHGT